MKINFPIYKQEQKEYFDLPISEVTSYTNIQRMIRENPGIPEDDVRIICNKVATKLASMIKV